MICRNSLKVFHGDLPDRKGIQETTFSLIAMQPTINRMESPTDGAARAEAKPTTNREQGVAKLAWILPRCEGGRRSLLFELSQVATEEDEVKEEDEVSCLDYPESRQRKTKSRKTKDEIQRFLTLLSVCVVIFHQKWLGFEEETLTLSCNDYCTGKTGKLWLAESLTSRAFLWKHIHILTKGGLS